MNSYRKLIPAILGIILCLVLAIYFGENHLDPRGSYTISDGELRGKFNSYSFSIGFYSNNIYDPSVSELGTGRGLPLDYPFRRAETLTFIFGDIKGLVAKGGGYEHLISDAADLDEYVRTMQEQRTKLENTPSGVIPEACAYTENYSRDGVEFRIDHRVGEIVWRLPRAVTKRDEQINLVRDFAAALGVESYFDFANPISTDRGIIVPIRIEGLPIVAATRDFLLDKDQELWLLKYQGYISEHMGLSLQAFGAETSIQSINTILPVTSKSDKKPVLSLEEALDSLKAVFDTVFIDNVYSAQHPYEIRNIYLGYGAVYTGDGEYSLEPLWVFEDEQDQAWDYCFLVNAHTGKVYQKISAEHFQGLNQ